MSEPLIIWLPEDLDEAWAYYKSGSQQGWAASRSEQLALSAIGSDGCIVICPGTWFRTFPHSLPDMKSSERLAAAGYAIEEKLAAPLDEQHIVLGTGDDQRVGVISQAAMENILQRLDEAALTPTQILAEYETFPAETGALASWSRTIHPGPMGYALDALAEGDNPLSLMPQMNFEGALNYAQGNFARRQSAFAGKFALRAIAASFLAVGLTWLLWQASETRAMNQQVDQLKIETAELYTEGTGKAAPTNPALAVTRELRRGGAQTADFLSLSSGFIAGMRQVEGVSIETLRFNADRGQITLKLTYPDFGSASALEQVFANSSGQFKSGAVREQNGILSGEGVYSMGEKS